jgi:hypothetical protein
VGGKVSREALRALYVALKVAADIRAEAHRGPRVRGMFGLWPVRSTA